MINEEKILNSLKTKLFDIELEHPIILGAGVAKSVDGPDGLHWYSEKINTQLLMLGTITKEKRSGNSGDVFFQGDDFSLNRMGLPNKGISEIEKISNIKNHKYIGVSISGQYIEDICELCHKSFNSGASIVEVNISCPNTGSRIIGYDPFKIEKILIELNKEFINKNIALKLPIYIDEQLLLEVSDVLNNYQCVKGITIINSVPKCAYKHNGIEYFGGMSGRAILPIALGQINSFKSILKNKYIIGGGGVSCCNDVALMREFGADAVFVTTAAISNYKIFDRILDELIDYYND